jgi:superfamily II DNA helicase RecQ
MAENKSNKQYFERALSKSLTKFGRWKNSKTSHVFESLLLTLYSQDVFAVLPTAFGKSRIYQVLPALYSELHRLLRGTIENFVVAVVNSPLAFKPCTEPSD